MENEHNCDLLVIGGGPAGYVAAIRAAQLGFTVTLAEKAPSLGGTCLNVGCIPSKALLASSEHLRFLLTEAAGHGLRAENIRFDLDQMMRRKAATVQRLTQGIQGLMRKNNVTVLRGTAAIRAADRAVVTGTDGAETAVRAGRVLIASGSEPTPLPDVPFNGESVISSTEALALGSVPKRLVIAGAGAIGLELGSVWARLGSEVRVIEFLPDIANGFDADIRKALRKELESLGIQFHLATAVTGIDHGHGAVRLHADSEADGHSVFDADKVLVAVGRRPFTAGLFRDGFSVETDGKGRITVNDDFETSQRGVFAIGDVIPGPMLAHKAEEDGVACVERMAGIPTHVNHHLVPNVIYTSPEAAGVGLTEQAAREAHGDIRVGRFPYMANGRAMANGETTGFVKIVATRDTGRILGAHILSPAASELIAEVVAVMAFHGTTEDLARTIHAHPTLAEATKEAALTAEDRVLHL